MADWQSPLETRPRVLAGQTRRISTSLGTAYVTLTHDQERQPFEVFLNMGKAGSETFASAEALGRLISLALRLNSPLSQAERVRDIVDQLEHIGSLANDASMPSLPDAVAQVLQEFLADQAAPETHQPPSLAADTDEPVSARAAQNVQLEPLAAPKPAGDVSKAQSRRNLPTLDLTDKRKKQKNTMDALLLNEEILHATEQLAAAILQAEPIAAYQQAKVRLDNDDQARELLERFLKTQSNLRVRQSRNAITQADVDELRALQRQVQSNRIILDYAETQQAAIAYLPGVNQEISQLLGLDFASLAGQGTC